MSIIFNDESEDKTPSIWTIVCIVFCLIWIFSQIRLYQNRKTDIYSVCKDYEHWSSDDLAKNYKFSVRQKNTGETLSFEEYCKSVNEEREMLEEFERDSNVPDERWQR